MGILKVAGKMVYNILSVNLEVLYDYGRND
mgnify:CR=1 FL=1